MNVSRIIFTDNADRTPVAEDVRLYHIGISKTEFFSRKNVDHSGKTLFFDRFGHRKNHIHIKECFAP